MSDVNALNGAPPFSDVGSTSMSSNRPPTLQSLTEEEKAHYEFMANRYKEKQVGSLENSFTSDGRSIAVSQHAVLLFFFTRLIHFITRGVAQHVAPHASSCDEGLSWQCLVQGRSSPSLLEEKMKRRR